MTRGAACAILLALLPAWPSAAQEVPRVEVAGALQDSAVPASIRGLLGDAGLRVTIPGKSAVAIWLAREIPEASGDLAKLGVVYPFLPPGTLVAVARFTERWVDFRGKAVPAGTYALRYAIEPTDGNHSGVSDYRDFLVLVPAGSDPGERVVTDEKALLALGRKATGTNHPAVMSLVPAPKDAKAPSLVSGARATVTLFTAVGQRTLGMIVSGKVESDVE